MDNFNINDYLLPPGEKEWLFLSDEDPEEDKCTENLTANKRKY